MPRITYSTDYETAGTTLGPAWTIARDAIAFAIAGERERCATVVENMGRKNGRVSKPNKIIAAEIRSARNQIGKSRV